MKLTDNFSLHEFLLSQTATRHNINMDPPIEVIDNLRRLCVDILQPLRTTAAKPISISSGYRPVELNRMIGGSTTSAHIDGRAADFTIHGFTPLEAAQLMADMDLPYDQVIHEFGKWVHVGIPIEIENARLQELTAYKHEGATRYDLGLRAV